MSKAKSILITVAASMAVGAVLGMLYAPVEGSEARKKLRKLKHNLGRIAGAADDERETLEELIDDLQNELNTINHRLEKV